MNVHKVVFITLIVGFLMTLSGCGESHAQKKQEMIQQWEKNTASSQLPMIENLLEQGQLQKAKEQLAECIQADPEMPEAYILIGRIHFLEARNEQARIAFEQAVQLDPQLDKAWHFLGSLAILDQDYERALENFNRALELMPSKADYIISLSEIYIETDQFDKAQEIIGLALERHPRNLELILAKAKIYQQSEQTEEAIGVYEQALLIHGDLPEILEPAGYAYIAQDQWSKAAEKFSLLIAKYPESDPRYNVTMRSLASSLLHSNQYGKALFWYDKLSLIYRDDAEVWLNMAQASLGLDNPKRAAYCAAKAIKIHPAWAKAYAMLGSARYMQGLYEQSLNAFYKITNDDELGGFAWFMSGRCYQQLGQNRQANAAFEKAQNLDPENELIATFLKKTVHPL